jgi:outer membrane protein
MRGRRALLLTLALLGAAPMARAQTALPAPIIVVVDMTQIMREAKAAKDVQSQVERQMNAYSKEVSQKEGELKSLRDDLERQRTALAPDVFQARSQEYQQRYVALDRDVQAKRQALQQSYSESMTKVENVALQIISEIAKERKANIVVAKAALLYMEDALDMSGEVTRRLNDKLPTMAVGLPKETGEVAAKPKPSPPATKN